MICPITISTSPSTSIGSSTGARGPNRAGWPGAGSGRGRHPDLPSTLWAYDTGGRALFVLDGFGRLHAHGAGQCGLTAEEPTVDRTAWITYHALSWPPTSTRAGTWTLDQLLKEWPPEVICPAHGSGRDPARDGDPNHGTGPDRGPRGDAVPTIGIVPGVRPSSTGWNSTVASAGRRPTVECRSRLPSTWSTAAERRCPTTSGCLPTARPSWVSFAGS